jgi:predicted nucleic acid-binding protein
MMPRAIIPDTEVLIDFLRGNQKAIELINQYSDRILLSSLVVAELYAGVRGKKEQDALEEFISLFQVIPVDEEIAKRGGLFRRDYAGTHGVGLADGILAATAIIHHADLKTLNVKHYPMLKSLSPAYKK